VRLFYALWPDPATRAALAAAASELALGPCRRVPAANLHLTLLFVGEVDSLTAAALRAWRGAPRLGAFRFDLDRVGWWRGTRVTWLAPAVVPEALGEVVAAVRGSAGACGVEADPSRYAPHVTVARRCTRAPVAPAAFSVPWTVEDYVLVRSTTAPAGARYEVLERWPLASA
jgi:2'-5' RNA ligase